MDTDLRSQSPYLQHSLLDGTLWLAFWKLPEGYLIRFPGLADFLLSNDQQIRCASQPNVPQHTIEHLVLDHVLPRVLSHEGRTVLHAAAMEIDGRAIAFLGDTGWGKSTLTASLWRAGYPLVNDDCVVIMNDDPVTAVGTYPGMRLLSDSALALGTQDEETTPVAHYSSKRRISVNAEKGAVRSDPILLQQVYLLTPPNIETTDVNITEIPLHERFIHLLEHSFRLDPTDKARNAAEFGRLTTLAERLPMFRLQYPRRFDALPDVHSALLTHVASTI